MGQQVVRGGVEVHAHLVHAGIHDGIQALLQGGGRNVVLVLAHADALGIDLHQFGQGILQAPRDGNGAADGEIEIGEFLARDVAGAVHAGARFADHDHRHLQSGLSMASRMKASVSRPAVPLPTAMARMLPFLTSSASSVAEPASRPRIPGA
jgi:hypothetical protein